MQDTVGEKAEMLSELTALRSRVAELEVIAARHEDVERKLARLANFPEQNPNMVIELDLAGHTTYLNPVAQGQFPDLQGHEHPILHGLLSIISALQTSQQGYFVREVEMAGRVYEQKICCMPEDLLVRVYVHDQYLRQRSSEGLKLLRMN